MITLTPTQSYLAVAGVAAVSAGLGGVGGYFLANKRLKQLYEDLSTQEIEQAKVFYQKPDLADLAAGVHEGLDATEEAVEELSVAISSVADLTRDYRSDEEPPVSVQITKNVFEREAGVWDYEIEFAKRAENDGPYIIHHDEFLENTQEHDQITVTYFEEDGVLIEPDDSIIENETLVIGDDNLQFGHGSKDNNVVYIRNEDSHTDFEVIRSTGSYANNVLGLKHSDYDGRPRKFRHDSAD